MEEAERIQEVLDRDPGMTPEEVASEVGCSISKVLKYQMDNAQETGGEDRETQNVTVEAEMLEEDGLERFQAEKQKEEFEQRIQEHGEVFRRLEESMQNAIVGMDETVRQILIALVVDGNVLLEGVPGLGKSLLVETLSRAVDDAEFNRIQFVPDMLPSDILGQRVYNQKKGEFYINKGPVFTDFLLADEINRAPPKTQAALMEVMQEKKVSIEKESFDLEPPYLVMATQNPLEQKGTYPLPEAIIDRFFIKLVLDYPNEEDESEILKNNSIRERNLLDEVEPVASTQEIIQAQKDVRDIHISEDVSDFIVKIIRLARGETEKKIEMLDYIDYGPSPRASIWISLGASARAMLEGRSFVTPRDVKEVTKPILRHRILLNYEGKIKDVESDDVIDSILNHVEPV